MPVRRIILEPIGRFAFLAVGVHVLLGGVLWWWLQHSRAPVAESPGNKLTWVSPSDFSSTPPVPAATPTPAPAVPSTPPAAVPEIPAPATQPVPVEAAPVPPMPAPVKVAESPKPPVPEAPAAPPAKPAATAENNHEVPKAIALDPAQAMAIMAKVQAAEAAKAAEKEKAASPAPAAAPPSPPAKVPMPPATAPAPPVPPATKPADDNPPPPPTGTETARFVTVSLKAAPQASKAIPKVASLLDMAALDESGTGATGAVSGIRLDEVDRAVIDAFMREWLPPDASRLRIDQRTAHLDMAIDRSGRVLNFKLTQPSGSIDLDMSVLEAADRLDKIGAQLPASYSKDRYEFQVNLHAE